MEKIPFPTFSFKWYNPTTGELCGLLLLVGFSSQAGSIRVLYAWRVLKCFWGVALLQSAARGIQMVVSHGSDYNIVLFYPLMPITIAEFFHNWKLSPIQPRSFATSISIFFFLVASAANCFLFNAAAAAAALLMNRSFNYSLFSQFLPPTFRELFLVKFHICLWKKTSLFFLNLKTT